MVTSHIIAQGSAAPLRTMLGASEAPRKGALLAYGLNRDDLFRRAAYYVDRILKGASPADLPVERPTRFYLVVNLAVAEARGITLPAAVLREANSVVR